MKIELERGLVTSDETDINIQTVARISVEELKKIGDDEALGTLLMEFVHKMTTIKDKEGILINKDLVDMLIENFTDKDNLLIGVKVIDDNNFEPILSVLKENGTMSIITKEEN